MNTDVKEERFKNKCLTFMRHEYYRLMKSDDVQLTDTAYCWHKNNFLHLYLIFIPSQYGSQYVFYACDNKRNKDVLTIIDIANKKGHRIDLIAEGLPKDVLRNLIAREIISRPKNLIGYSVKSGTFPDKVLKDIEAENFNSTIKTFLSSFIVKNIFTWEITHEDTKFASVKYMNLDLSPNSFFERTFSFNNVIRGINDKQFTDELDECLFAYNNKKWFICATSIGSILEGLIFNIIKINRPYYENLFNNKKNWQRVSNRKLKKSKASYNKIMNNQHATAADYINVFMAPPINATDRPMRLVEALFILRNAVDHFNSGRTNRNLCDLLLHGITDLYNDYYIRMMKFRDEYDKKAKDY